LDDGVQPSDIIVLVQRKHAARVILNALKVAQAPAKSSRRRVQNRLTALV
jgi:ATP-dependent exoDNAse (exonuclease V) beta subunit